MKTSCLTIRTHVSSSKSNGILLLVVKTVVGNQTVNLSGNEVRRDGALNNYEINIINWGTYKRLCSNASHVWLF